MTKTDPRVKVVKVGMCLTSIEPVMTLTHHQPMGDIEEHKNGLLPFLEGYNCMLKNLYSKRA
jgi:hypothetical protein